MTTIEEKVNEHSIACGITPRLIDSKKDMVSPELMAQLPLSQFKGFGLQGSIGVGKSCAVSWFLLASQRRRARTRWRDKYSQYTEERYVEDFIGPALINFNWVYWPDCALAHQDANRFGLPIPSSFGKLPHPHHLRTLNCSSLLVLDDIGRERGQIGSYTNQILDSVVNYRYEHKLDTIWTTNLDNEEFINQYGVPFMDRLLGMSPANGWISGSSKR